MCQGAFGDVPDLKHLRSWLEALFILLSLHEDDRLVVELANELQRLRDVIVEREVNNG